MDIETLKDQLEPAAYAALSQHVAALSEKLDKAVSESIQGRKTLKADNERLKALNEQVMEKLGISDPEELDSLPDLKGQAAIAKQVEVKMKRLERELAERSEMLNKVSEQRRQDQQSALLAKALQAHEWNDNEVVENFISSRITWEDDQPRCQADGKLVSIDEGVKWLANTKPALLKSRGAGGSGYNHGQAPGANAQGDSPTLDLEAIYAARQPQPA